MSIKSALINAFKDAGESLPKKRPRNPPKNKKKRSKREDVRASGEAKSGSNRRKQPRNDRSESSSNQVAVSKKDAVTEAPQKAKPLPKYALEFTSTSKPLFSQTQKDFYLDLMQFDLAGSTTSAKHGVPVTDEQEIFLGLDFGTSSVKAVVGDRNLKKAYAVPFRKASEIDQYLLPTQLYQSGERFRLEGDDVEKYSDLKLRLMNFPDEEKYQLRVIGFLALAIQRIRAWFFTAHFATYQNAKLLWTMNIGVPSTEKGEFSELLNVLGWAAWILAANDQLDITLSEAKKALVRARQLLEGGEPEEEEDVIVETIPEIAAQVYGYVKSDAFDPHAQNLFLMADVGAGTIDCALFKVRQEGVNHRFDFYTKSVEPLGVTNLHKRRLEWWQEVFDTDSKTPSVLKEAVAQELTDLDSQRRVPEKFSKYFEGVEVKIRPPAFNPDITFTSEVADQIQRKTLWKAKNDGDWHTEALKDTPFYLCGGGTRMQFFQNVKERVQRHPSVSYLRLSPKRLSLPNNIVAPGLRRDDWDRLSVAYGLSFADVGEVVDVEPLTKRENRVNKSWAENYIEK